MALQQYKLSTLIIEEYFGPVFALIADELKWGPRTLKLLSKALKLPISTVKQGLSIFINFNFVEFRNSEINDTCEYNLLMDNILLLQRYSKFMLSIREKYGEEAKAIIQELLLNGRMTLSNLILKVTFNLSQDRPEIPYSLSLIKNHVCELTDNYFIIPTEKMTDGIVPVLIKLTENEKNPNINLKLLSNVYQGTEKELPNELYWKVNFDRFLIEYRDEIMITAITSRIDSHAGVIMRHLLKLSIVKTDLWRPYSNPVPMMQIRDSIGNNTNGTIALKYADQYLKVMEEDSSGFIRRSVDYSNGIMVCFKDAINKIISVYISQVIEQKFGSKAARVYRLVETKKYCELEQIQQLAMLPDKEAKQITYKLLEENFLHMQDLRKPTNDASSSSGPNKAFFLFYVNVDVIVQMLLSQCSKSMSNIKLRAKEEQNKHMHVIEKKRQSDLIISALKEQNTNQDQILEMENEILTPSEKILLNSVNKKTKKLQLAELQIDETIFLLQLYMRYNKTAPAEMKTKKRN